MNIESFETWYMWEGYISVYYQGKEIFLWINFITFYISKIIYSLSWKFSIGKCLEVFCWVGFQWIIWDYMVKFPKRKPTSPIKFFGNMQTFSVTSQWVDVLFCELLWLSEELNAWFILQQLKLQGWVNDFPLKKFLPCFWVR